MSKALIKIITVLVLISVFIILFEKYSLRTIEPIAESVKSIEIAGPVKILLVPGHDNDIWGAKFGSLKEADMNLELATKIFNILNQDKRFKVYITRDQNGYTNYIENYLASNQKAIITFRDTAQATRDKDITDGSFVVKQNIEHNSVASSTSIILYGINDWSDIHNMNAVLHIHFNDYPRKNMKKAGKYKGFAIYVPDTQNVNAKESKNFGQSIFTELKKQYTTSTYPGEAGGMISDQSLIALGANGTLNSNIRSILVEYGYIYRFINNTLREKALENMAQLTAVGIQNYFFPENAESINR